MDLALNNQQRLICHKTQTTNQLTNYYKKIQQKYFNIKEIKTLMQLEKLISFYKVQIYADSYH